MFVRNGDGSVEMNAVHMETGYSKLMIARESATITVHGRDPNAGRGVGKLYDEKKGGGF